MQPYDWLLLDADNTLFDFNRCEAEALRLALLDHEVEAGADYHATYSRINKQCWREYEDRKITKEVLRLRRFNLFFETIGVSVDPNEFGQNYLVHLSTAAFLLEGALELLSALQPNYRLALVTNGLKEVQRPRLKTAGLERFFDCIVVSDEIGHAKPHAPFFDYAFASIGRPDKDRVLIVGDNINADIRGGLDYGIHACWYNPDGEERPAKVQPTFEIRRLEELLTLCKL